MGTVVTIDVYIADGMVPTDVSRQLAMAQAILQRADAVFSTWQPHSPVSRLRRGQITRAQAPAEVSEVLAQCAIANAAGDIASFGGSSHSTAMKR